MDATAYCEAFLDCHGAIALVDLVRVVLLEELGEALELLRRGQPTAVTSSWILASLV